MLEHWDGGRWSVVAGPKPPGRYDALSSVHSASSGDVWAVGSASNGDPIRQTALIEHWDGSTWQVTACTETVCTSGSDLLGVRGTAQDDAWAVGYDAYGRDQRIILHWDGTAWKES